MRSAALLATALVLSGCSSCNDDRSPGKGEGHDTVSPDDAVRHVQNLEDQALLDRAKRSPECGFLESEQCSDPAITQTRCELSSRAADRKALFDALLTDAKSKDRATRGYALRVLALRSEPAAVDLVEGAVKDADKTIACPAARYGMYFRHEVAARLVELAALCDTLPDQKRPGGDPIIADTAERVRKGTGIVRASDAPPCE